MLHTVNHPFNRIRRLPPVIPDEILASRLMRCGGYEVFDEVLNARWLKALRHEAVGQLPKAILSDVERSDGEEVRGGNPARRFFSAPGAAVQDAYYRSAWMLDFVRAVVGVPLTPTGMMGTYTYYRRHGDFLAVHRDIEACDVAVITCLFDNARDADVGGLMSFYPKRLTEPLSAIRRDAEHRRVSLRLHPRQTIVMYGGIVPHAILPTGAQQVRIVSVLCYRALTSNIA
ncbi:MAG: hypothetical protein MSG64_02130 [Pyrinomonadaceae bacterium MAG19_C2-C3]|nr:hypothetical protein [Pyrinomonadaceae bacterium MAG19_C2-C3]